MPSFRISITPNRRAAARFVTAVRRAIQKMYSEESNKRGLKQTDIARAIGVHRSVINRQLHGREDISLARVAELAWAMGRKAMIDFPEIKAAPGSNVQPDSASRADTAGDLTLSATQPPRNDASTFSRKLHA